MRQDERLEALGRLVASRQDASLEGAGSDEVIRQNVARHAAGRNAGPPRRLFAPTMMLAAMVLGLGLIAAAGTWKLKAPAHLGFTVGAPPVPGTLGELLTAPSESTLSVRFSEGTMVLLQPSARARVTGLRNTGADLILESGRAHFEIKPNRAGDWSVRTGPFAIRVKGTKFDAAYDPQRDDFLLELQEGGVTVSGCSLGRGRTVIAGERLQASCRRDELPSQALDGLSPSADNREPIALGGARTSAAPLEPRKMQRMPALVGKAAEPSWIELARAGRYDAAYELARTQWEWECRHLAAGETQLLGDVARLSGHPSEARRAYMAVRDRFPRTPESADVAFALGRVALEADGDHVGAERWFETHLRERPDGPLASAALGRLLELHWERGDSARATVIAREYVERYPHGPHALQARKLLEQNAQEQR